MNRFALIAIIALLATAGVQAAPLQRATPEPANSPAIAVVEAGQDDAGQTLYNVTADNAEMAAVLKALFARTGDPYGIAQDVVGPIDLRLRGATLDQALQRIAQLASPPLRVERDGQGYHIARDPRSVGAGRDPVVGAVGTGGRLGTQPSPIGSLPADRYITIEVPRAKPISLAALMERISQQTRVPIVLDRRVPRDVQFYGNITRASLPLALQTIADTVGLKVVGNNAQAYLVPRDEFFVLLNTVGGPVEFGHSPATRCPRCAAGVVPGWRYCPRCAAPLRRPAAGR